jgi:hypothetical protein
VQLPQATHFLGLIRIVFPSREKHRPINGFGQHGHLYPAPGPMQGLSHQARRKSLLLRAIRSYWPLLAVIFVFYTTRGHFFHLVPRRRAAFQSVRDSF